MTGHGKTFKDRLTPEHVQELLDELQINWRSQIPSDDGWVTIPNFEPFNYAKLGINILHGGFKDFTNDVKGDIVNFVRLIAFTLLSDEDGNKNAIKLINRLLGLNGYIKLEPDQMLVKEYIDQGIGKYAMVPNNIWGNPDLSPSSKIVWIAIQERCGRGKNCSWAGYKKLSEDTSLSRNTVAAAVRELKDHGFLTEVGRGEGNAPKRYPLCKTGNYKT